MDFDVVNNIPIGANTATSTNATMNSKNHMFIELS